MLSVRGLEGPGFGPIDLDLAPGACAALRGPSGAGKSRLLRAIVDLDPHQGRVTLGDDRRGAIPAPDWRRLVRLVPAESGWWADRVGDHFSDARDAASLLEAPDLPAEALNWEIARASTGERQRLALARALLESPRHLLLDEPTASLDASARDRVEALIRERIADGAGVLIVTHDPAQAERLAARPLSIVGGRLMAGAAP